MDDTGEFEAAFDALAAVAYRVGFRLLGDRAAAEDIAQETLARALVHWRRVRGHSTPWVVRVAAHPSRRGRVRCGRDPLGGRRRRPARGPW